jgi:hypothetical protein
MAGHSTDPGDRSAAELEREVDRERARVSATIDALQSKASLGTLVDEVMKVVRENGGDMGRNLGRTVRDNPLPALLTGVGLAWLMLGGGRPARWDDPDEDPYGDDRRRPIPVGDRLSGSERFDTGAAMGGGYASEGAAGAVPRKPETSGFAERAADAASGVGARVSEAAEEVGARASGMAHAAGDALSGAGRSVRSASGAAGAGLSRARRRAGHMGSDARQGFDDLIEGQPLVLGALALAVGAAIGGALPSSQAEDRMFGARSERAKATLRRVASEEGRKLGATAGAVAAEAAAIADETSAELAEKLPEGRSMAGAAADRVKEVAVRLRDAGVEEAERQELGSPKDV